MKNERGSTLVLVLIVLLVFSVLGLSVVGNAMSERTRVHTTELDGQARVLAQSGLTYFETQFEKFVENNAEVLNSDYLFNFIDSFNKEPAATPLEGVSLGVKREGMDIEVTSLGTASNVTKKLTAYYRIGFDIDKPTEEIADFTEEGTVATNFADDKVLGLNLGLLGLGLLNPSGNDQKFYTVPPDDIISVRLLGPILGLGLSGDGFKIYRERNVIATRQFTVLGVDLLGGTLSRLVALNVLGLRDNEDTNVLINGHSNILTLLGIQFNKYSDIEFKKFAVVGNALIQQDRDGSSWASIPKDNKERRRFTFDEGLYVNRSLVIGGPHDRIGTPNKHNDFSELMLRGNMVAMDNLTISYVDLVIGDKDEKESGFTEEDFVSNIYVHGDAHIHHACIRPKDTRYQFGVLAKGEITLENYTGKSGCNTYSGLFYSEKGIDIKTNGRPMTINGGLVGNITVDGVPFTRENGRTYDPHNMRYKMGNLTYNVDPRYMEKLKNVKLVLRESPDE